MYVHVGGQCEQQRHSGLQRDDATRDRFCAGWSRVRATKVSRQGRAVQTSLFLAVELGLRVLTREYGLFCIGYGVLFA